MNRFSDPLRSPTLPICLLLMLGIFVVFGQTLDYDFVGYDDNEYIVDNELIHKGFTRESLQWAFTVTFYNWHPLTWISHILDYELYELNPKGHHFTSLLFHLINSLLLFLVFKRMTGALWRSAFVAALFAIHPLNVESVAWIAERKNVLSTFFWILTIWAYVRYVEYPKLQRSLLVLLVFALGLMAKPMLVTLPFVLLLLDFWPLGRIPLASLNKPGKSRVLLRLVWEKLPLFALAAISCIVTYSAQGRAMSLLELDTRIGSALTSYVGYIAHTVWPSKLAVFYPYHVDSLSMWKIVGSGILLVGITVLVLRPFRRRPYLAMGWFWYIGTLVPVIGLVQVGAQAMADRYTYIPLIGLFIMISWGAGDLADRWRLQKSMLALSAGLVILALTICSWLQAKHWRNTITLFDHAQKSTVDNYLAHFKLGKALTETGMANEAFNHFSEAVRIKPNFAEARNSLGIALLRLGKLEDAMFHFSVAIQIKPADGAAYSNMGDALTEQGKLEEAIVYFSKALKRNLLEKTYNNLGLVLLKQGKFEDAVSNFSEAIKIKRRFGEAYSNMGVALAALGKLEEAAKYYSQALEIRPDLAEAHYNLGNILAVQGKLEEAIAHYSKALATKTDQVEIHHNMGVALVKTGKGGEAVRFFENALALQPDFEASRLALEDLRRRNPQQQ